jgi:hypothetical protein
VDVVAHRIDFNQRRVLIFQNPGDVGMALPTFFIAQKLAPAFGAEYEMHNDIGKGLGHIGVALSGLGMFWRCIDLGLRSPGSLPPRLSPGRLSAWQNRGFSRVHRIRAESPSHPPVHQAVPKPIAQMNRTVGADGFVAHPTWDDVPYALTLFFPIYSRFYGFLLKLMRVFWSNSKKPTFFQLKLG